MRETLIRVYRPVSAASAESLDAFQDAHNIFPQYDFERPSSDDVELPPSQYAATLIESRESARSFRKNYGHTSKNLRHYIHPYPETGNESLTLNVKGVDFFGSHFGYRALALLLDDADGHLQNERAEYMKRMRKESYKRPQPHVSVLKVDINHTTSDLLAWAESIAPTTVTLDPIMTYPVINPLLIPLSPESTEREAHFARSKAQPPEIELRDLTKNPPIPAGFLNALRNAL